MLRDLRNRIGHHEPIINQGNLDEAWKLAWKIAKCLNKELAASMFIDCRYQEVKKLDLANSETQIPAQIKDLYGIT